MRIIFFLDMNPCSLVDLYHCFEGMCCLHHQRRESSVLLPMIGEEGGNAVFERDTLLMGIACFSDMFVAIC
jgi:hypothetical protein